jgi:Recombination endonuclease VII
MEVKVPSAATLKKYGLTAEEWLKILADQNNVCFICQKYPSTGRLCVDHYHVPKWKSLPPEQRKLWIRGILCWFCNHSYVGRAITVQKAERVVQYLKEFEAKRPR